MTAAHDVKPTTPTEPRLLSPEEIGQLVKSYRGVHGWTQEVLAELSGLQTRTIQRVEQGNPSSLDTRRALAHAFEFDDIDYFNTLKRIPSIEEVEKWKKRFDREHLLLDTCPVEGRQLLTRMQGGPDMGAICAMNVAELPRPHRTPLPPLLILRAIA